MSGKKISELQELLALENDDLLLVVDSDEPNIEDKSKNVKIGTIRADISSAVADEAAAREGADLALSGQITTESQTRLAEDIALQEEIDNRVQPIETRSQFKKIYAYNDNFNVYADGELPTKDPSPLNRDGWYFTNTTAASKINWYFFDGNPLSPTYQGAVELQNFSAYAVVTLDSLSSPPILALYTLPTGVDDVIPGFAHSRVIYSGYVASAPVIGEKCVIYTGQDPLVHPELPRFQLAISTANSIGDQAPSELVLTSSFGSNSAAAVSSVQFLVESLGVNSPNVKQEMELRLTEQTKSNVNFIRGFNLERTSGTSVDVKRGECSSDDFNSIIKSEDTSITVNSPSFYKGGILPPGTIRHLYTYVCKRAGNGEVYYRLSTLSANNHLNIVDDIRDAKKYVGCIPMNGTINVILEFFQLGDSEHRTVNLGGQYSLLSGSSLDSSTLSSFCPIHTYTKAFMAVRRTNTSSTIQGFTNANPSVVDYRCTIDQYDGFGWYAIHAYHFSYLLPAGTYPDQTFNITSNQSFVYLRNSLNSVRISNVNNGPFTILISGFEEDINRMKR